MIHGDFNLGNILVQQLTGEDGDDLKIIGIIDFSDMHSSYFLFDIALTACYISLHNVDRYADSIALLLLGYDKQLPRYEFQLLKVSSTLCKYSSDAIFGHQSKVTFEFHFRYVFAPGYVKVYS